MRWELGKWQRNRKVISLNELQLFKLYIKSDWNCQQLPNQIDYYRLIVFYLIPGLIIKRIWRGFLTISEFSSNFDCFACSLSYHLYGKLFSMGFDKKRVYLPSFVQFNIYFQIFLFDFGWSVRLLYNSYLLDVYVNTTISNIILHFCYGCLYIYPELKGKRKNWYII